MARYANWREYERGGRHGRIIKSIRHIKCEILDENDKHFLVDYGQDGPVWILKDNVNITEE